MTKSKYGNLLSKAFEKYKDIETISVSPTSCVSDTEAQHEKMTSFPPKQLIGNCPILGGVKKDKSEASKERKNRKFYKMKRFSPDEDEVLLNAMQTQTGDVKFVEIAKKMGRNRSSVKTRFLKLKSTGSSKKTHRSFHFEEDCVLIDAAIQDLRIRKSLETTNIPDVEHVAASFNREVLTTRYRWENQLRHWLLRYYNKTLNLEIRPMLTNVLAENFSSIEEIDWMLVSKYPEFSGFNEQSLRTAFYTTVLPNASRRLKIDKFDLTLKQISKDAEVFYKQTYNNTRNKKLEQRKRDVIEYFENAVKELNIKDFV